jgi:hypothetical protein
MRGSFAQNEKYCSKEGSYEHFGDRPKQGNRTDIESMVQRVKDGELTADEIALCDPEFCHQYAGL